MPPGTATGAVSVAFQNLEANGHSDLVRALLTDLYIKSPGFKVTPAVETDLARIKAVDPTDGSTLSAWAHDSNSVMMYFLSNSNLQDTLKSIGNTIGGVAGAIGSLPSNSLGPITAGLSQTAADTGATQIAGLISAVTSRNFWIRLSEGIVGLLLVGIGIAALTKDTSASKYVGKAVKYIK